MLLNFSKSRMSAVFARLVALLGVGLPCPPRIPHSLLSEPIHWAPTELQAPWSAALGLREPGLQEAAWARAGAGQARSHHLALGGAGNAGPCGGELMLCQAYSRCSINACSREVRDGVLGAEGRAGGIGGGEKAGLGGQCHKNLALMPGTRTTRFPLPQTTSPRGS